MKKISTSILLSLLCIHLLSAQEPGQREIYEYANDWSIGIGINGVNDSGLVGSKVYNVSDYWNFGNPFYISAENYINNEFSVGATISFNKYKEGKIIDGKKILINNEASYIAFDLAGKYSFRDLLKLKVFEPYGFIGVGYTYIGDYKTTEEAIDAYGRMTFNTGLGANYWFTSNWGINLNVAGKWGLGSWENNSNSNQIQINLGALYSLTK